MEKKGRHESGVKRCRGGCERLVYKLYNNGSVPVSAVIKVLVMKCMESMLQC